VVGDKYKNRAGTIGIITDVNGVLRLVVKNVYGKITQTISLKNIELSNFEKVD